MSGFDEPAINTLFATSNSVKDLEPALHERIRALMTEQPYAVLCTQGGGQPYGSMVAFAANRELNTVVFATPITTRKYRLLSECGRVALVIDNRVRFHGDLSRIEAVTATGKSVSLSENSELELLQELLIHKHPYMQDFICAPSTALICINIIRYLHVVRLQEVHEWIPPG